MATATKSPAAKKPAAKRTRKAKTPAANVTFRDVARERLVPVNNGFGSWDGFLFGEFNEVGQKCLNMADHVSLDEALQRGKADFDVALTPAKYAWLDNHFEVPGRFVTVRTDTGEALGTVGDGYNVVANKTALAVAHAIDVASPEGGNFIGCATVDNGRQVAAIYALPLMQIGADEEVLPVLLIWTSHDGSKAVEVTFVPMRLACWNGNLWHAQGTKSVFRVKHTATAEARLATASAALAEGNAFFTAWANEAAAAAQARIDNERARELLYAIVEDKGKGKKADTIREKTVDAIMARYVNSENLQNVRGTKYALAQAVAEYVDHEHRTRLVATPGMETFDQLNQLRFLRSVSVHPLKEAAHAVLLAA